MDYVYRLPVPATKTWLPSKYTKKSYKYDIYLPLRSKCRKKEVTSVITCILQHNPTGSLMEHTCTSVLNSLETQECSILENVAGFYGKNGFKWRRKFCFLPSTSRHFIDNCIFKQLNIMQTNGRYKYIRNILVTNSGVFATPEDFSEAL